ILLLTIFSRLFSYSSRHLRALHSFPTRRSSDLRGPLIARSTRGCGYAEQIVVAPDGSIHPCHLLDGAITHVEDQPMQEWIDPSRSEEHTSELQSQSNLVCRLLLEKKKKNKNKTN